MRKMMILGALLSALAAIPASGQMNPACPSDQSCAADFVRGLIQNVENLNLQKGIANSLDAKLEAAYGALADTVGGNDCSAAGKLEAFSNEVRAQVINGTLQEKEVSSVLNLAMFIIEYLDCR